MPGESFGGGPGGPWGSPTRKIEISDEPGSSVALVEPDAPISPEAEAAEPFSAVVQLSDAEQDRFNRQKELVEKERLGEMHKQELLAKYIKIDVNEKSEAQPKGWLGKTGKFIRNFGVGLKSAVLLGESSLGLRWRENKQIRDDLKTKGEYKVTDEAELAVLRAEAKNLKTSLDIVDQKTAEQYSNLTNRKLADKLLNSESWGAQRAGAALVGGAVLLKMPFMAGARRALNSVLGASGAGLLVGGGLGALKARAAEFEKINSADSLLGQYETIKSTQGRETALGVLKQSLEHGQASFKRSELLKIAARYRMEMREEVVDKMAGEAGLEAASNPTEREAVVNRKFVELQRSLAGDENDLTRMVVERLGEGEAVRNLYEALSQEKNKQLRHAMIKGAITGGTIGAIAGAAIPGIKEYLKEHGGEMLDHVVGSRPAGAMGLRAGELPTGGAPAYGHDVSSPAFRTSMGEMAAGSSGAGNEIHSALQNGRLPSMGLGSAGVGHEDLVPSHASTVGLPSGHGELISSHAPSAEATYGRSVLMPSHTSGEIGHSDLILSHEPVAAATAYSHDGVEGVTGGHGVVVPATGRGELIPPTEDSTTVPYHMPPPLYGRGALEPAPIGKTYTVYDVYDNSRADKYFEDVITKSDPLVGKGLQTNYGSAISQVVHDNAGHFGLDPVRDRELLHILKTMNAPVDSKYASIDPSHSIAANPEIANLADPAHRLPDGELTRLIGDAHRNPENYQYHFTEKEIADYIHQADKIREFIALHRGITEAATKHPELLKPPYVPEEWFDKYGGLIAGLAMGLGTGLLAGYIAGRRGRRGAPGGPTPAPAPGPTPPGVPPAPDVPSPPGPPTPEALRPGEVWTIPENSIYRITPERAGAEGTASHLRRLLATAYPPAAPPPPSGWNPFRGAPTAPPQPTPEQQEQARQDLRLVTNEALAGNHIFAIDNLAGGVLYVRLTDVNEANGQLTFTQLDGTPVVVAPVGRERIQTTLELPADLTADRLHTGLALPENNPGSLRRFLPQIQSEHIPLIVDSGTGPRRVLITGIPNDHTIQYQQLNSLGLPVGPAQTIDLDVAAQVGTIVGSGQRSRFERSPLRPEVRDAANIFRYIQSELRHPAGMLRESIAALTEMQRDGTIFRVNLWTDPAATTAAIGPAMIERIGLFTTPTPPFTAATRTEDLSQAMAVLISFRAVDEEGNLIPSSPTPAGAPRSRDNVQDMLINGTRGWDAAAGAGMVDAASLTPEASADLQGVLSRAATVGPQPYHTPEALMLKSLVSEFEANPVYFVARATGEKRLFRPISFNGRYLEIQEVVQTGPYPRRATTGMIHRLDMQSEADRRLILNILPATER